MSHSEYIEHVRESVVSRSGENEFLKSVAKHQREADILLNLNLDPALPILKSLYSSLNRSKPRNPLCMLRSLILMALLKFSGITAWVDETRSSSFIAIMCGFEPGDTPGVGTYYGFQRRIINGPYQKPCEHTVRRSVYNTGSHLRDLKGERQTRKDEIDPNHSQSEKLIKELLPLRDAPRQNDFYRITEDLMIKIGMVPSIEAGLIPTLENVDISGDGSILETAASSRGKPSCSCRSKGKYKCDHPRFYTSPTAMFCHDHIHDCFIFGDRYYHLIIPVNGHDFPLNTYMPGGNVSDYILSLMSLDRFIKAAKENGLDMNISTFCGDGHHDSYAHYQYLEEKKIIPIIPLSKNSHDKDKKQIFPHLSSDETVRLDADGAPLCPGDKRMRHHNYGKRKKTHVYCCPAKRNTHRNGKSTYVIHMDECPNGQDCKPNSSLGPLVYVKSETDPRLYPPIPRDSSKFKVLMNQRSGSERVNFVNDTYHLDGCCRNADYGLIRLTMANIAHHASLRYIESAKLKNYLRLSDLLKRDGPATGRSP
ncbi:MAG: hypothetical protein GY845_17005 [Planctomycetes bacterium]|nr:hypothetical protein [Planctomycetota bacterium]